MGDKLNETAGPRAAPPSPAATATTPPSPSYRTVAETDGIQVTAALLHGAVSSMTSWLSRGYRAVGDDPGRDEVAARLHLQAVDLLLGRRRNRCDAIPEDVR